MYSKELYHHGIKGQRWGIRRYQNYDGSYTQAGVTRYKEAAEKFNKSNEEYLKLKNNNASEVDIQKAKEKMLKDRRTANNKYDRLKTDMMADKGKRRYQKGQTITGRAKNLQTMGTIASGAATVSTLLYNKGKINAKQYVATIGVSAGMTALGAILDVTNRKGDKELRAYYSHSSK